jgi:hypothetical protein
MVKYVSAKRFRSYELLADGKKKYKVLRQVTGRKFLTLEPSQSCMFHPARRDKPVIMTVPSDRFGRIGYQRYRQFKIKKRKKIRLSTETF